MKMLQYVSFTRKPCPPGIELWELIVTPNKTSLTKDISNSYNTDRLIKVMIAQGYSTHRKQREDGARVVTFSKP